MDTNTGVVEAPKYLSGIELFGFHVCLTKGPFFETIVEYIFLKCTALGERHQRYCFLSLNNGKMTV